MPTIASQWRAFWHTLTSNDRHADYNSPYRTGNHVALPQNRHTPLTSVATNADESRMDLGSPESASGFVDSNGPGSPGSAYSPGMRSKLQRQGSGLDARMDSIGNGEIQMQNFNDGLPPPPPVSHSWKRIDAWLEDNYEELFENMGQPATINDVNMLEHELDCTLPQDVRESLQLHDGQERGGVPTGVIFGCMLLDCEEIVQEWQNWRTVNEAYFGEGRPESEAPQISIKAFAGASSSAAPVASAAQVANPQWRQELLDKQDSQPDNAVQKVYAHPAWIPLARDWGGNNIAVDLAPGPHGKWGQIILMGRDYDCKYVISRSWAAFLATLADDMNTDKWFIDEDTKELKLREFKQQGVEPAYIDILRWRSDQKHGRKRQSKKPLRINSNVPGQANGLSPYASPSSAASDDGRGRSPNRFPGHKGPSNSSPRGHISSPLARVTEESGQPLKLDTTVELARPDEKLVPVDTPKPTTSGKFEKLVPVDTPVIGNDENDRRASLPKSRLGSNVMNSEEMLVKDSALKAETNLIPEGATSGGAEDDEMKEVKI